MVSIMPGIENFAPERTETSSGFSVDPSVAPAAFSSFRRARSRPRSPREALPPFFVVEVAGVGGDREPGRHRQAGVGHLGQARALAAERVLHRAVAVGLAVTEEVHVLLRRGVFAPTSLRGYHASSRSFAAGFFAPPLERGSSRVSTTSPPSTRASRSSTPSLRFPRIRSRVRQNESTLEPPHQAQPRLAQRRVLCHHQHIVEKRRDRGPKRAASAKACLKELPFGSTASSMTGRRVRAPASSATSAGSTAAYRAADPLVGTPTRLVRGSCRDVAHALEQHRQLRKSGEPVTRAAPRACGAPRAG
jgi:hypothetical protein